MEMDFFKGLMQFGGSATLAWVLWVISRRFMDAHASQVKETQAAQNARITALEEGHKQCEAERQKNADIIVDLLKGTAPKAKRGRAQR